MPRHFFALALFCGWTAGVAGQTSSDAGVLADAFVQAWNAHDGRAFGRLYADDADWATVGGERLKGRDAVEGALGKEHASWARTTTLRATDVAVRVIDSGNAIVMFRWEITRTEASGVRPLRGNTLLVAAKQEGVGSSLVDRRLQSQCRGEPKSRQGCWTGAPFISFG